MRHATSHPAPPDGTRRQRIGRVLALLGRGVIAFHPRLITLATPGKATSGWHRYERNHLLAATGLSRAEFYHARKILREAGFVAERRIGLPPRSEWRLDLEAIAAALEAGLSAAEAQNAPQDDLVDSPDTSAQGAFDFGTESPDAPETRAVTQLAGIRTSRMGQNPIQGCGETPYKDAENPQTGNPDSGQLDFAIPANQMAGFQTNGWPDSERPIEKLTTGTPITAKPLPLTPSPTDPAGLRQTTEGGGGAERKVEPKVRLG